MMNRVGENMTALDFGFDWLDIFRLGCVSLQARQTDKHARRHADR